MYYIHIILLILTTIAPHSKSIQPWPITVEKIGSCCDLAFKVVGNSNATPSSTVTGMLDDCVASSIDITLKSDVAILTFGLPGNGPFAVPDIQDFAVYQRAIMSAYAETNRYMFRSITPDNGLWHNCRLKETTMNNGTKTINTSRTLEQAFGTSDYRWFKVKFLLDALDTKCGWAKETKFIVWIGRYCKYLQHDCWDDRFPCDD